MLTVLFISGYYDKYRLYDLSHKYVFLRLLEARKPKIKVSADSKFDEDPISDVHTATFLLHPQMTERERDHPFCGS